MSFSSLWQLVKHSMKTVTKRETRDSKRSRTSRDHRKSGAKLCLEVLEYRRESPKDQAPRTRLQLEQLEVRMAPAGGLLQSYGQLPLSFEANAGQTAAQVQYLAHGSGYALFLSSTSAMLTLEKIAPSVANPASPAVSSPPASVTGVALAMNLVGANPGASVAGLDEQAGTSNYMIGNDPSKWHTGIANYGQVAYQDVYPGVNLLYYGNQQQLEYDFVVAPGADPGSIRLSFQGADSINLDNQGNLVLSTASSDVLEQAPVVYQVVGGARQAVAGQFVLLGQNEVGFQVGPHDASLPLTIDPVLSYSTYLGGIGSAIAVDGSGNAYVTGTTNSIDFPTTAGAYQTSLGGGYDAFVTKLNAAGTALVYSTYVGGTGNDYGYAIALDGSGNAYVTGLTTSSDFPTTVGAYQTSFGGADYDTFVTKLNATGTALAYSTYLGGTGNESGNGIVVDGSGNAYVTGFTSSSDFPTTPGVYQTNYIASSFADAFVTKVNATGSGLSYSTYLGVSAQGVGIVLDAAGNAYMTGDIYAGGRNEPFVTKLNPTGTALVYSTEIGGFGTNGSGTGESIAVDGSGNAYVTGITTSSDFPTTAGAFQTSYGGGGQREAYVAKLNAAGTALIYSTYLGSSGADSGNGIAVDGAGNAYITGWTYSTNFPTTADAYQTSGPGAIFLTKLNATGTALIYSTHLGGTGIDIGYGIALDGSGNAYVTGEASSSDFPTTAGAYQTSLGNNIGFVAKFTFGSPPVANAGGPYTMTYGGSLTLDASASSDPDGDPLSYSWTINGHANAASIATPTLSWSQLQTLGVTSAQSFAVSVQVSDGSLVNSQAANVAVNMATLTITANDQSKVYGTTFTFAGTEFSVSGLANSDTVTSATLSSGGAPAPAPAGSYDIAISAAAGTGLSNYIITYHKGIITIGQATLPVLVTSDLMLANSRGDDHGSGDGSDGARRPPLTGTANGSQFTGSTTFTTAQGDTFTVTLSSAVTATSPVGVYPIIATITGTAKANYVLPTSGNMYVVTVGHDSGTGAKNVSFWDNKGNAKLITVADLAALDQLNLRNDNGSNFDPTTAVQLDNWLRSDTEQIVKSLSIQLAVMDLNILSGSVRLTDVVNAGNLLQFAGSTYSVTGLDGGGFITIGNLMTLANNALANFTTTRDGDNDHNRLGNYLDALEDSLEAANNNTSFVQQLVPAGI